MHRPWKEIQKQKQQELPSFYHWAHERRIQWIQSVRDKVRTLVRQRLQDKPKHLFFSQEGGDSQVLGVIHDAIAYVIMQAQMYSDSKSTCYGLLERMKEKKVIEQVCQKTTLVVSFAGLIKKIKLALGLTKALPDLPIESLMKRKDLTLELKLAIQLFLHRGSFVWKNIEESEFRSFLFSKDTHLSDYAMINCWEGVLYMMYKAKMLSKDHIKTLYLGSTDALEKKLSAMLQFKRRPSLTSENTDGIRKQLSGKAYLLMMDRKKGDGLWHTFLSVPYTHAHVLDMLLTRRTPCPPANPKVYSLGKQWTQGHLGSVSKKTLRKSLSNPSVEVRSMALHEFQKACLCKESDDRVYVSKTPIGYG